MLEMSTSSAYQDLSWRRGASIYVLSFVLEADISSINHYLSKFVNTHLFHSRQWFNIHISIDTGVR